MRTLQGKFFISFVSILFLSLLSLYLYLPHALSRFYLQDLQKHLTEKGSLIRDQIEIMPLATWNTQTLSPIAKQMSRQIGARITFIDPEGSVLADSEVDTTFLLNVENHLARPEIQQAVQEGLGISQRFSQTIGKNMFYVALKMSKGFVRVAMPTSLIEGTQQKIKSIFFVAIIITLLMAVLASYLLARSFGQAFKDIASTAAAISQGDFSKSLYPRSKDELGHLAHSINHMSKNLRKQLEDLENEKTRLMAILESMVEGVLVIDKTGHVQLINPALALLFDLKGNWQGTTPLECFRSVDIHDSLQKVLRDERPEEHEITFSKPDTEVHVIIHTAPLRDSDGLKGAVSVFYDVTNVRKLENMRRDFVANVSHELKTPLTNILGYAETLRQGALQDTETAPRFVEKIEKNARQLKQLVEDILKISEVESGRFEFSPIPLSLREFVDGLHKDFEEQLTRKKISLEKHVSSALRVLADPSALRHVLANLLENAIKYTPGSGHITMTAEIAENYCKITIQDTGIGIDEKDLPHVFERFYRADKSRSREMGGTGLGLAIVKHLTHNQGGEVGVTSELGKGSAFFVTLPLS